MKVNVVRIRINFDGSEAPPDEIVGEETMDEGLYYGGMVKALTGKSVDEVIGDIRKIT